VFALYGGTNMAIIKKLLAPSCLLLAVVFGMGARCGGGGDSREAGREDGTMQERTDDTGTSPGTDETNTGTENSGTETGTDDGTTTP
jgi:hypothetical protein